MGSSERFRPRGIIPAMVTPFNPDGSLDEEGLRELASWLVGQGIHGLVVCGTTGEFVNMTPEERKRAFELVVEEVGGKVPVIAGTGDASTQKAIELTRAAEDVGADAALVVTPFYMRLTDKEVYEHYETILSATNIPIILYNIPQCTGNWIDWWVAEGLAREFSAVSGIKDSSGSMPYFMTLLEKLKGLVSVICGHDEMGAPALMAGADGLILASANLLPDVWVQIYEAIKLKKAYEEAAELQRRYQTLLRFITRFGGPLAVKTGLWMTRGRPDKRVRRPLMPGGVMPYEVEAEMRRRLEGYGRMPRRELVFILSEDQKVSAPSYMADPATPEQIEDLTLLVGEAFTGPGSVDMAHIDLLIGLSDGPVGLAFEEALKEPQPGHEPRVVELNGRPVEPKTLLVPTVAIRTGKQAEMVYGPAMRGVARAVVGAVEKGLIPKRLCDEICMIAHVFVHPTACNPFRVELNNFKAMDHAIKKALESRPTIQELMDLWASARHPFRYEP